MRLAAAAELANFAMFAVEYSNTFLPCLLSSTVIVVDAHRELSACALPVCCACACYRANTETEDGLDLC